MNKVSPKYGKLTAITHSTGNYTAEEIHDAGQVGATPDYVVSWKGGANWKAQALRSADQILRNLKHRVTPVFDD